MNILAGESMVCDLNCFLNGIKRFCQEVQDVRAKRRTSRRILKIIKIQNEVNNYLRERYVAPYLMEAKFESSIQQEKDKIVWQYWDTGLEKAPRIVKASINSVRRNLPSGYKHIVLSDETIRITPEEQSHLTSFRTTFFQIFFDYFCWKNTAGFGLMQPYS